MSADLLDLARRVYGLQATVSAHGKVARVEHGPAVMLHVYGERSAEAIEAALLVLAGEGHVVPVLPVHPDAEREVDRLFGNALQDKVHRDVGRSRSYRLTTEPPAWVDQLASAWEAEAQKRGLNNDDAWAFQRCAEMLRERAKRGEPCE